MRCFITTRTAILGLAALACLGASAAPAAADLIGTTVTGSLAPNRSPGFNLFDPSNGFVPSGYGNSTTVSPVVGGEVEFGYTDQFGDLETVDLTGTTVTLTAVDAVTTLADTITLTDVGFSGLVLKTVSNGFQEALTVKLTGDVIKVTVAGTGPLSNPQTNVAVFSLLPKAGTLAEPASIALLGVALAGAGMAAVGRRRG